MFQTVHDPIGTNRQGFAHSRIRISDLTRSQVNYSLPGVNQSRGPGAPVFTGFPYYSWTGFLGAWCKWAASQRLSKKYKMGTVIREKSSEATSPAISEMASP